MMCSFMFVGELCVFIAYGIKKCWLARKAIKNPNVINPIQPEANLTGQKQLKTNPNPFLLAIPAVLDLSASTLMFIALTMTPASIYQMMRGSVTIITALMSMIFLKRKQYRHHWVGLICIVIALASVGYVAIAFSEDGLDQKINGSVTIGVILLIVSQFFAAGMYIVEEYFIAGYHIDPLKVVGTEGMWGTLYSIVALTIMQAVHCSGPLCNYGYAENSAYAFR